jgi:hypothetical protein
MTPDDGDDVLTASGGVMLPTPGLLDTAQLFLSERPFATAAAGQPRMTLPRGGLRYYLEDDSSPDAQAARANWRWNRIMDVAATILCTCTPARHHCGSCEGHLNETCPIHGDEGEWML